MWSRGLAFLRAIDVTEADAFRVVIVQDFEGVAVKDRDDGAGGPHTLKRRGRPIRD